MPRFFNHILSKIKVSFLGIFALFSFLLFSHPVFADPSNRFNLGPTLEESLSEDEEDLFEYSQEKWNEMREAVETGREPGAVITPVAVSTVTAPPKPPPGLLQVELPYESALSITGRKVINLELSNTHITKERAEELGSKQDTQTFEMKQELQARIQGTVARKTTINVNFDDTKENVKDFSVVYKGDPDEVVQEAAFGDIVLSLPSTEFVNYNKQLFGLRTALKYKKFGFMAIGSRTKGTTETKRFTGTTTRQQRFVNDVGYTRFKFYDLTYATATAMVAPGGPFFGKTILPLSDVPEEVYVEDTTGINPNATVFEVATPTAPTTTTVPLRMRQMSPGVDYSIDRIRGIITFTVPVPQDVRIAIDFTLNNGERLGNLIAGSSNPADPRALLVKDRNPETPGVSQEIKRFYFVGDRNINRDNGLGNFVFKVLDKNRETEIGDGLVPIQRYPDTIEMKFETGIFELQSPLPFSEVYASNVNAGTPLQAVFSIEYQSIVRTFTLRPNIVLQSEKVEVNGRKVTRDLDYFIDYDIGILTFFNEDLIRESTVIEVTYEFAPFGGVLGETLVGARGTYDAITNKGIGPIGIENWGAGSTVLYNFAAKPTGPPDIRSTPASLLVLEGDTSITGLKIGKFPMKTNLKAEAARSINQPNLFGKALIDSMEGIKQEDTSSMLEELWLPAANPVSGSSNITMDFRGRETSSSHIRWGDIEVNTSDPNDGSATAKALNIDYSLNTLNNTIPEQVSLINVMSLAGRDFSKKTTLEVEVEGAGSNGANVELQIEYGSFNEDSDGDGILDTEDQIPFDGVLNLGEDIGYVFNGPGDDLLKSSAGDNTTVGIGNGNARLDTEDLNGDRQLAKEPTSDLPTTFTPLFWLSTSQGHTAVGDSSATTDLNFTGRKLFQIPINISSLSAEEKARWTSVKQVRVTLRNTVPGTPRNGTVRMVRLSVVGNTYEPATVTGAITSTMTVKAVNNKDNSNYTSLVGNPDYNDLYKDATPSSDAKEQALALEYNLAAASSGTTRSIFGVARDFSKHKALKFFVTKAPTSCGLGCGGKFILQAGSETEYQQVAIDLLDVPASPNWMVVKIRQSDLNNDGTPDTWSSETPQAVISQVGAVPNLTQISQIKIGIVNDTAGNIAHEVWVNEIHQSEPNERVGHAKKYSFNSLWEGWMDFGGSYRDVDRNWQTPTTAVTNQDSTQSDAFVNFNRIGFLPMTFKNTRDRTVTPSAFRANQNALVSFLEEGRVERVTNASTAKLILPKLPIVDFNYSDDSTENTITQRKEGSNLFTVGASYAPTSTIDVLPSSFLTFRPVPNSITYLYSQKTTRLRFPGLDRLTEFAISTAPFNSTNLTQFTHENEVRMAFKPWNGFTFNPSYKQKVNEERRDFREDEIVAASNVSEINGIKTPRSISQNIDVSGNLRLTKWFEPRYSYSFNGTETNGLPTLSSPTAYNVKTITRNSQGELSGSIQINQILPNFKPVDSLNVNSSYRLENGDTYSDVPKDFKWRDKLWVGRELDISTGTGARRTDLTDRRTFRTATTWQPWSAYRIEHERFKPFNTLSLTSNYLISTEDSETTGTSKRVVSVTWPDLILTINDIEDLLRVNKMWVDNSRMVLKTNTRKTETRAISRSASDTWGTDYQFQFRKKYDIATSLNLTNSREDNLITNTLTSKTDTLGYSVQTRLPWRSWAFTPRFERSKTETRDALRLTNDLLNDIFTLQIYGDITKPLGIRIGRKEIGLANRFILNSTIKWDKKRSNVNPGTNFLDIYSATLSGDYTISQNFRLALGGNFSYEVHHPDFKKLDKSTFGINSTLTIQF